MAADHTVFNLCKYRENSSHRERILDAGQYNGLFGFDGARSGVAHVGNGWITDEVDHFGNDWVLSSQCKDLYRGNGQDFTNPAMVGANALASNLDINHHYGHDSDWACAEIIVVNERLSDNEIQCVK
eukprot:522327_1